VKVADRRSTNCAPEKSKVPLRGMSFWEHHLPWALLTILQIFPQIKREPEAGSGSAPDASRAGDGVC